MKKKKSNLKRILIIFAFIILFFTICFGICFFVVYNKYDLNVSELTSINNGIKVYSSTGTDSTLYNTDRSIVEIETLPAYVCNAFVDTEDKRFYSHNGFDAKRIIKASFVNLTSKTKSQGASTISQQLIKNALLTNDKTYSRKIQEIVLAMKMEKKFEKDEILEMYLNTIYFGSNAYGIENASNVYFDKSAKDLTLNEACCLAGMIKSPNTYSPTKNPENCEIRRNFVALNMLKNKHITNEEYESVINSEISVFGENKNYQSYEEEAIYEACALLNMTERELINKKYQIITFKDDKLQSEIEKINENKISYLKEQTQSNLDSLSVVANSNGEILAYFANSAYNLHNLRRQPASTFKPFSVYLPCFKYNIFSPSTQILDEKIDYSGFSPKNADNTYHGYVSVRDAIAKSYNIPAVKALDYVGIKKSKEILSDFGFNISNSDLNLNLALGATQNGVRLIDLLSAYNTLSNLGTYHPISFVKSIKDESGNMIYSHEDFSTRVANSDDCFLLTDCLKTTAKTGTAKRLNSLSLNVASKTGTASNEKGNTDIYNIAYTTEHTMLTWIGNLKDNVLPTNLHSSSQPTDINKDILSNIYSKHSPADFQPPENVSFLPFDYQNYEFNHTVIAPMKAEDRYKLYDWFKSDFTPENIDKNKIQIDAEISKYGVLIKYNTQNIDDLYLITMRDGKQTKLKLNSKESSILDKDVFSFNQIEYHIEDEEGNAVSNSISMRPKDYLVNLLNSEIVSKKKWYV